VHDSRIFSSALPYSKNLIVVVWLQDRQPASGAKSSEMDRFARSKIGAHTLVAVYHTNTTMPEFAEKWKVNDS